MPWPDDYEPRTKTLQVRMTERQWDAMRRRSKELGLDVADYVRRLIDGDTSPPKARRK